MTYLAIFVPDFPVEAVLRVEPELRSQLLVILEGKPPQQKVFALNETARHAGLEAGMTRPQAEAWPDLAIRCRSSLQEQAAHAALLDCAQSFSPRVEDTAPDTILLDISGTESLFGPPVKLARDVAQRAANLGLEANIAVASNPDAATVAARGYSGITILNSENQEERLGHLPLDVLFARDCSERETEAQQFLDKLERWGIRTLRAFTALPMIAISERLGQKGVYLQKLARGANVRTLVPIDPPLNFEEAVELEHPLVLLEPLAFLLNRLLEQVCARLAARALATQKIQLKLELDPAYRSEIPNDVTASSNGNPQNSDSVIPSKSRDLAFSAPRNFKLFTRTLHLPVPMLDAKIFLKLLQLDLRSHPPGAPITKIWLSAEPARLRLGQVGLFTPPAPEPEKLELTMARISGIVGEGNVGAIELLDTYRPEGFRMQHFTPRGLLSEKKANNRKSEAANNDVAILTALRLFRPPHLTTVTMREGIPIHIACASDKVITGDILWQTGPWRSSGDWWEQEPWAHDEWDIALQTSIGLVLYRLVHDLLSGCWFVEGTYD